MSAMAVATDRGACWCDALLDADVGFNAQAERERLPVRRFKCAAGHSHYLNSIGPAAPAVTRKVTLPLKAVAPGHRRCCHCAKPFKASGRRLLCPACRGVPPCRSCNGRGKHYPSCSTLKKPR